MKLPFGYFIGKLNNEQLERKDQMILAEKTKAKLKAELKIANDDALARKRQALQGRAESAFAHLKIAERYHANLQIPGLNKSRKAALLSIITDRVESARAIGSGIQTVDNALKVFSYI